MPIPARSVGWRPRFLSALAMTVCVLRQISIGSCSTPPGLGKICSGSSCDSARMRADSSKTMKRVLLVPWSMAPRYVGTDTSYRSMSFGVVAEELEDFRHGWSNHRHVGARLNLHVFGRHPHLAHGLDLSSRFSDRHDFSRSSGNENRNILQPVQRIVVVGHRPRHRCNRGPATGVLLSHE